MGIQAHHGLGVALQRADEQHGDTAHLKSGGDVGVVVHVDAVEVHRAMVVLGDIAQDGCQTTARHAPVGIEVHDDRARTGHLPVVRFPVGYHLLETVLVDGMDGIDRISIFKSLGIDGQSHQRQQNGKEYSLHCQLFINQLLTVNY